MPFWTTAAILGGTALAGSAIAAHSSGKAADAQVSAADRAAQLQHQDSQAALAENKRQYDLGRSDLAPWRTAGSGAITTLSGLLNNGGFPDFNEQFQAPTSVTEQNDPGFQFRLQEGQKAIDRTAAARGGVLSGGTLKAQQQYGQDYASNEYNNVYGRAFNEYSTRRQNFMDNNTNKFNRYAAISGVGQQATNTTAALGSNFAHENANILLTSGQQIGNDYLRAGDARASGYINSGNIWSNGLSDIGSLALLKQLQTKSGPFYPNAGG